ncbi:MAG: bifunctional 2-C-methyl-D-erythritol 4-phosphate cytidylyltransferase/2-C-methyl-D-erythritol 2,4-cyclodiphosphate synthase [Phenylobacterium sp.]
MTFSAVIVAAGASLRAGPGEPKPWRDLGGRPVLDGSARARSAAGARRLVVVTTADRIDDARSLLADLPGLVVVEGGAARSLSVRAGLAAVDGPDDEPVLVHDAARPFLSGQVIARVLAALETHDGAIAALPVANSLKRGGGVISGPVDRQGLWRAQTPQAFRRSDLLRAFEAWTGPEPTDEAAVMAAAGARIALVAGDPRLFKLTWPEDFDMAESRARPAPTAGAREVRMGQGIDAHRWGPGDGVWLCGVRIPHDAALVGHSDADAGLHALTDALLGAIGEGDIGQHFPPSDPRWRGEPSATFLAHAGGRVAARGGRILSLDLTLVCERPKVAPHREVMRASVAAILGLDPGRVSIKATTTEGMGYTGREEGLLAQAIAAVELPAT